VFLWFSQLVADLLVLVVLVPVVVVQVLVVLVLMMVPKDSSPYQFVEDLADQLSVSYYKTSVFPYLSSQQTHRLYTIHRARLLRVQDVLPVVPQIQIKIGRNNYRFFVCNNVTEDTIPHFLIFIHHLI
jgi:hypothetical protein